MRTRRNKKSISSRAGMFTHVYRISINTPCLLSGGYNFLTALYKQHAAHSTPFYKDALRRCLFHTWLEPHFFFCIFIIKQLSQQTVQHLLPPHPPPTLFLILIPEASFKIGQTAERQRNWWPGLILSDMNNVASLSSPQSQFQCLIDNNWWNFSYLLGSLSLFP